MHFALIILFFFVVPVPIVNISAASGSIYLTFGFFSIFFLWLVTRSVCLFRLFFLAIIDSVRNLACADDDKAAAIANTKQ